MSRAKMSIAVSRASAFHGLSVALALLAVVASPLRADLFRGCIETSSLECSPGVSPEPVENYYPDIFAANPIFDAHFEVYVCWIPGDAEDPGAPAAPWNVTDLQEFAAFVVSPILGDETGMAKGILDYFGEDAFPADDEHFGITTQVGEADVTYDRFKIYIFDTCRWITAGKDYLSVHIEGQGGQFLTPWAVARDAFAHEWQHVCHNTWTRVGWKVDEFSSFDEMCSVLSVAKYGRENTGAGTLPYDATLNGSAAGGDFTSNCMNAIPVNQENQPDPAGCDGMHGNVYNEWAMFAIYLENVFTLPGAPELSDSLVYRWIREHSDGENLRTYHHDFVGLGKVLDHPDLDALFSPGASPHQRLIEALRSYGLAKFLNLQSPGSGEEVYQWLSDGADPDGYRPQELYNFLRDADDYCYNNIHAFPLYHPCTEARQKVSGWQISADHWPTECALDEYTWYVPEWAQRRLVGVQTYASNYIVLLPPMEPGADLSFTLRFLDGYPCMRCPPAPVPPYYDMQTRPSQYEGQARLAVDLIGYDLSFPIGELDPDGNGLDLHGESMRTIASYWVEPEPNQVVDFNVADFGTGDNEVIAVVLSLVPKDSHASMHPNVMVPYEYRFQALPSSVVNLPDSIGPDTGNLVVAAGEAAWVQGEVMIERGYSLTVEAGATVYFRDDSARITADGGSLIVRGSEAAPVEFLPSILVEDTNADYAGLFAENMGLIDLQHCRLNDAVEISADSALVRIADSAVYMAENDDNAIVLDLQNGPRDPAFVNCEIANVNRIRLDAGAGKSAEVAGCIIAQRVEYQELLSNPPALVSCIKGTLCLSESELYYLKTGVQVGEKYMPYQPSAYLGPSLQLYPHSAAAAPEVGIQCKSNAVVEARYCRIEDTRVGVKVWDAAQLLMDHSNIHGCVYGVSNYAVNGAVDLGRYGETEGQNFIAPSEFQADCWHLEFGQPPTCTLDVTAVKMTRVYNATTTTLFAESNAWGTCEGYLEDWGLDCMCPTAFFRPDPKRVGYSQWIHQMGMTACNADEFPGFSLGVAGAPEAPEGAWPNPFNGQIHFRYRTRGVPGVLEIHDILGRRIRSLTASTLNNGDQEFVWMGDTNEGHAASSGVYLYRVVSPVRTLKGKVVYVK